MKTLFALFAGFLFSMLILNSTAAHARRYSRRPQRDAASAPLRPTAAVTSDGTVRFSSDENCDGMLVAFVASAQRSADVAFGYSGKKAARQI